MEATTTQTKRKHYKTLEREFLKNPEILALCLYILNKKAKRHRDNQRWMAEIIYEGAIPRLDISGGHHDMLHACKSAKENCYNLKEKVLEKAIKLGLAEYVTIHRILPKPSVVEYEKTYAKLYRIGQFTFHSRPEVYSDLEEEDQITAKNATGIEEINTENDYSGDISERVAQNALSKFVNCFFYVPSSLEPKTEKKKRLQK